MTKVIGSVRALSICAAYFDRANGWVGAGRHALTVGFVSTMVFAIGQRVLYSPRLMLACLLLLEHRLPVARGE